MIDPTFQQELMGALQSAVSEFNKTAEPNSAVIHAAKQADFNPEQTRRLVETFNTARTIYHYDTGEKTANFPVASADKVLLSLLGEPVAKEAAAPYQDYAEYDQPEMDAKQGSVIFSDDPLPPLVADNGGIDLYNTPTLENQAHRVVAGIREKRAHASHAEDLGREALLKAENIFKKIATELGHVSHDVALDKYARLQLSFDSTPEFYPIMARLHDYIAPGIKEAMTTSLMESYGKVIDAADIEGYCGAVKSAQALWAEYANHAAIGSTLTKEAAELEQSFDSVVLETAPKQTEDPLGDFFPKRAADIVWSSTDPYNQFISRPLSGRLPNKQAPGQLQIQVTKPESDSGENDGAKNKADKSEGLTEKAISTAVGSGLVGDIAKTVGGGQRQQILAQNQKMTERLKNTQRQILLQDLLVNDPMISEAAPEQVAQTYEAVMQMAPEVTTNKEVMRSILRQAIHSVAISPYDAKDWLELEKIIQDVRGTRPPQQQVKVNK